MQIEEKQRKSRAKKIKLLLKKYQGIIKAHYETANFKEPVLFLMRRSGEIEFYEDATSGYFEYRHSDGEDRYIMLDGYPNKFLYGKKRFTGYICHEDSPFKLPSEPVLTSEMFTIAMEKTNNDYRKWKLQEKKQTVELWKTILIGIAAIILAYAMYKLFNPTQATPTIKAVAKQTISNISQVKAAVIK